MPLQSKKRKRMKKVKVTDPRYDCPRHNEVTNLACYRCGYRITPKNGVTHSFPYWTTVDRLETLSAEVANRCLSVYTDLEPIPEE